MNITEQNIRSNFEYLIAREDGDHGSAMHSLKPSSRYASVQDSMHTGDGIIRAHDSVRCAERYLSGDDANDAMPRYIIDLITGETYEAKHVVRAGAIIESAFRGVGGPDVAAQQAQQAS